MPPAGDLRSEKPLWMRGELVRVRRKSRGLRVVGHFFLSFFPFFSCLLSLTRPKQNSLARNKNTSSPSRAPASRQTPGPRARGCSWAPSPRSPPPRPRQRPSGGRRPRRQRRRRRSPRRTAAARPRRPPPPPARRARRPRRRPPTLPSSRRCWRASPRRPSTGASSPPSRPAAPTPPRSSPCTRAACSRARTRRCGGSTSRS